MNCNCFEGHLCVNCKREQNWARIPIDKKISVLSLARAIENKLSQEVIMEYAKQAHPYDCIDISEAEFLKVIKQ
jgi:hypothetical protein